jgi:hypothetical protein
MIPVHHIQRAIHSFYAEVTERSLHLALRYPNHRIFAERTARKGNERLAHYIGILKSSDWASVGQVALQQLCRDAESDSLGFLREIQQEEQKALKKHHSKTE